MRKMRGVWYHWLIATVILLMLIIFFQLLTAPINTIVDTFDAFNFTTTSVNSSFHVTTQRVQTSWNWWAIVGAVILILMVFYISSREEYDTGFIRSGGY